MDSLDSDRNEFPPRRSTVVDQCFCKKSMCINGRFLLSQGDCEHKIEQLQIY